MRWLSRGVVTALFCVVIVGVGAAEGSGLKALKEVVFQETIDLTQPRYLTVDPQSRDLWVLWTTPRNELLLRGVSGKESVVVNQGHQGHSSGAVCLWQGERLQVVWREKGEGKELFFRSVEVKSRTLGEMLLLDRQTEPLTRIKMAGTANGAVQVVWYGERSDTKGRRYSIYGAESKDFGKTFSSPTDLTPQTRSSIYPSLLMDSQGNAFVFTEVVVGGEREMVVRKRTEKGWEEPVSLGKVGVVSIYLRPIHVGNRLLVFWFNSYEGVPVVEMAFSDDGGKSWRRQALEATRSLDLTGMTVVSGEDGRSVYLALSAVNVRESEKAEGEVSNQQGEDVKKRKDNVFMLSSHDGGASFSALTPLRHYPYETTRANLPNVVAEGNNVVVVWNDYRNIRANLYMNYSTDGGITWQAQDIPLEEPGKFNTVLHWEVNNVVALKDNRYAVLVHRFKDDAMEESNPVIIEFTLNP